MTAIPEWLLVNVGSEFWHFLTCLISHPKQQVDNLKHNQNLLQNMSKSGTLMMIRSTSHQGLGVRYKCRLELTVSFLFA